MTIYKITLGKTEIRWETKLLMLPGSSCEVSPSYHSKQFFLTTPLSVAVKYCSCIGLFKYSKAKGLYATVFQLCEWHTLWCFPGAGYRFFGGM